MKYVSLHHHSTYSYMDGYGLPEEHVARAADLGMRAIALTEHGNTSSHVKLEIAARKYGVQPIFGLEAYTAPVNMRETKNQRKWHMTMLAMNQTGYHNLNELVTLSWKPDVGFYRWPTILGPMLREHHDGLIVLSGCLDSKLACDLLGGKGRERGDKQAALRTLHAFRDLLGDRYYLEVQQFPEIPRAHALNAQYVEWSKKYGIPLVATSDCHYPVRADNELQKILHAAGRNTGTVAAAEAEWEYGIPLTLPINDAVIRRRLMLTGLSKAQAEQAIANTGVVADRCSVELPKMERLRFPLELEPRLKKGSTAEDLMRLWMNDGWQRRGFHRLPYKQRQAAIERVEHEMRAIVPKDFVDYFLMLAEVVSWTKDQGIPVGPARGSAAASLCCYLLRITEVNPLHYPLMFFERFIDPNRADDPDIDLDFDDDRRDEVRQHLVEIYGEDRVGKIGSFTKYKGKNSMDDVARVFEIPKWEVEQAKDFLVERSGGDSRFDASIEDTVELFPVVKELFEKYPDLYKTMRLEGNYKGMGVHAAGLVVGAQPLANYVARYSKVVGKQKNQLSVLSVDKYDGEYLGLLKIDALSLSTMGMIRLALGYIGMNLDDLYKIPLDDPVTIDAFNRADVTGIFQFEGRTMRMVTQELKPTTFMDLAAINALARPGPLHSGSTGDYIGIRHGRMEREDLHPIVAKICAETEGQIIYQEQILQITREIGQFPWTHASTIRKVISQKKGEAAFNELWKDFKTGAATVGIDEALAYAIWKKMVTAGTYAFNVAHCISYSMLGFWAQWLKQHHPTAFYAAQLQKTPHDEKQKDIALMRDMADPRFHRSLTVEPPSLTDSGITWSPTPTGVRAGYSQIPGIGEKTASDIIAYRDEHGFDVWGDLQEVKGIGPATVEKIKDFAERSDPFGLNFLRDGAESIRSAIRSGELPVPMPNTLSDAIPYEARRSEHVILGIVRNRNLQDLYENHRSRTGEDLNPAEVKDPELKDSMTLYMEDEAGLLTVKVDRWKYPSLKEQLWDIELNHDFVLMVVNKKPFYGKTVSVRNMWVISPDD